LARRAGRGNRIAAPGYVLDYSAAMAAAALSGMPIITS
jgi:hypothetical protein